jgi:xanthine dehydrogenase large subunit
VELASPATHDALFLVIQKRLARGTKEDGREAA